MLELVDIHTYFSMVMSWDASMGGTFAGLPTVGICYICNMICMHEPEGRRPEGECIHIKANHDCTCYICYVTLSLP